MLIQGDMFSVLDQDVPVKNFLAGVTVVQVIFIGRCCLTRSGMNNNAT